MSKFGEELRAKISRGDDISEVRQWFTEMVAKNKLRYDDFDPFEEMFWQDLVKRYERWQASLKAEG